MPKLIFFLHFGIHWGPSYHKLMGFKFSWRHQISLLRVIYAILAPNMDPPGKERGVRKFEPHHFWPKEGSENNSYSIISTYNKTTGVSDHLKKLWPIKHRHVFFIFGKCAHARVVIFDARILHVQPKKWLKFTGIVNKSIDNPKRAKKGKHLIRVRYKRKYARADLHARTFLKSLKLSETYAKLLCLEFWAFRFLISFWRMCTRTL